MVEIMGKNLPLLDIEWTEFGTPIIFLKTCRENHDRHRYELEHNLVLEDILWIIEFFYNNQPEPYYIQRFEMPALAYYLRYGLFKGPDGEPYISGTAARQRARFLKKACLFPRVIGLPPSEEAFLKAIKELSLSEIDILAEKFKEALVDK